MCNTLLAPVTRNTGLLRVMTPVSVYVSVPDQERSKLPDSTPQRLTSTGTLNPHARRHRPGRGLACGLRSWSGPCCRTTRNTDPSSGEINSQVLS